MDRNSHPVFIESSFAGSRQETAILLVGTAREFDIPQREIASTHTGYYISERLADVLAAEMGDEEETEAEPEAEPEVEPDTTAEKPSRKKKSSGNRAGNDSQEGE